jgi:hypothetical protein
VENALTCWPCWCTAQNQALRLCQRDVAAVCELRDAQAATVADVFVVVGDLCIAHIDLRSIEEQKTGLRQISSTCGS